MKPSNLSLAVAALFALAHPALAADADFNLTYHVERTPAAQLSIETCGSRVSEVARDAGLRVDTQAFPGQLVTVSGGAEGSGAFVAQCITVDETTVSVVQGIDYSAAKGALGAFADQAIAAVKAAAQ